MNDTKTTVTPDFMASWPDEARRTISELHNALWLALKASGGGVVIKPRNLLEWGRPTGTIEWLTEPSSGDKIIRLAGSANGKA